MPLTYNADDVEPILESLQNQVDAALGVAEAAEAKYAALQAETRVHLEKVASSKPGLDPNLVDEVLETLEDQQILRPEGREKIASELVSDPNNALRLLARVTTISVQAPQSGSGIPKSASATKSNSSGPDAENWNDVLVNGA